MQPTSLKVAANGAEHLYPSPFNHTLANGLVCSLLSAGAQLTVSVDAKAWLTCQLQVDSQQASVRAQHAGPAAPGVPGEALLPLLAELFCRPLQLQRLQLDLPLDPHWALQGVRQGLFDSVEALAQGCRVQVTRAGFWQHSALWLRQASNGFAQRYRLTGNQRHPQRPPKADGVVYQRHLPHLDLTFSLRTLDIQHDLGTFNRWMNLPNVASVWDQADDTQTHAEFLAAQQADPHTQTLFGCFDGEPFAYFELYWVKEDRLAPFCQAGDYDRGIHILVGNRRHQGPAKLEAWLRSLFHYAFLDDPRTQTVYGEPRIDNQRWIAYMQEQGGVKLREFDFPHKRAALMALSRETFFEQYGPR